MAHDGHRVSTPPLHVATHLAPGVLPAYALATRFMGAWLHRPAELIVAADYRRCGADIDHVCFVCSIPFLLLEASGRIQMEATVAPVLRGRRYGGRPVYFSDVVVRAGSSATSFADLRGGRWAYNEPFSHSGFVVVLHHLAASGAPDDFLGDWIEAGFHDESMRMVIDGRADWTAIDSQVLAIWLRAIPSLRRRIRVVATLGPSTIQPIVMSRRRLTRAQRAALVRGLLSLSEEPSAVPVLRAAGIERFVRIEAADYDDIRTMLATVRSAGLLPAWWEERWRSEVDARDGADQPRSTIGLTSPIQRSSVSSS